MKESKFIELLNLYVDHEIGTADAAMLEAEVQRNPKRRQIYREYCRMQQACTQLSEKFRTDAPAPEVEPAKVVAFQSRRRLAVLGYAGGLAAAACVAFVVVSWNQGAPQTRSAMKPQPAPMVAATTIATPVVPVRTPLQPAFGGLVREARGETPLFAGADRAELDWMKDIRLQRVSLDQLRFDTKSDLQPADYLLRDRRSAANPAEMTAFRFQK